ncbi:Uncharacterised protein [Bordetella pertussis]|nr:Uncharacterised protein [Bordetella pertussis]
MTSSPGWSGREKTLRLLISPLSSSNTAKSVNEPPISTPTLYPMVPPSMSRKADKRLQSAREPFKLSAR